MGGRDGGRGLSNAVPGGGNHRHTPGDRQRLNESNSDHACSGDHGWTSGVVYITNNNLTYRPVYIVIVHSVYMAYRNKATYVVRLSVLST